jgi:microcystin-dependent protein
MLEEGAIPFSPTGVFTPLVTFNDGTLATAEDQNSQDSDIAAGLSECMTLAGLAPATANIPMGGFKFTGLGPGSASTDSVNQSQLSALIPPGFIGEFGGSAAPTGWLLCFGQTVSQTTFSALFAAIGTIWGPAAGGTFTLPDFRGRVLAGADNMGGSAAGNLDGYVVGTTGGSQDITLTAAELPVTAYADTGHTHPIADPGHSHETLFTTSLLAAGVDNVSTVGGTTGNPTTTNTTGITVSTGHSVITNTAGGGTTPVVQPTAAVNYIIKT